MSFLWVVLGLFLLLLAVNLWEKPRGQRRSGGDTPGTEDAGQPVNRVVLVHDPVDQARLRSLLDARRILTYVEAETPSGVYLSVLADDEPEVRRLVRTYLKRRPSRNPARFLPPELV